MRLSPYPRYKAGPAKWLGDLPEHWAIERVKYSLSEKGARAAPALPAGAISFGRVIAKDGERLPEETRATYQEVLAGEYLINPINLNYDLISLRTALSSIDVVVSPAYIVAKPNATKLLPAFGSYLLYVFDIRHMKSLGAGVRQTIAFKDIGNCYWTLPPTTEQEAITTFLDRETKRIDSLIRKKVRFTELLKEKREALVFRAVTKGLDPNAPMVVSSLKWLGDRPISWSIRPVKYLVALRSGEAITSDSIEDGGSFPVYGGNGLRGFTDRYTHEGQYVLVGRQGALCGNVNYAEGRFWASEHALVAHPSCDFNTRWLGELLGVMNLGQHSTAAAQPGISAEVISNLRVPVPPRDQQDAIALFISSSTSRIDDLVTNTERSIELLKEHRSALITSAVTGKIDVRGLAAKTMKVTA